MKPEVDVWRPHHDFDLPPRGMISRHGMWAHLRTCWLNNVVPSHLPTALLYEPRTLPSTKNRATMNLTLAGAILALALWILTTFLIPVGLGIVHLLLAAGVVLLIRWWALRDGASGAERG